MGDLYPRTTRDDPSDYEVDYTEEELQEVATALEAGDELQLLSPDEDTLYETLTITEDSPLATDSDGTTFETTDSTDSTSDSGGLEEAIEWIEANTETTTTTTEDGTTETPQVIRTIGGGMASQIGTFEIIAIGAIALGFAWYIGGT